MSRIGKLPIAVPSGVTITVDPDWITVKGAKGELKQFTLPEVDVTVDGDQIIVTRKSDEKLARAQHGLMRALINNMVIGVTSGFEKKLEVNGVGFRVSGGGQSLEMALGFSHPVKYTAPEGVTITVDKMNITVSGASKQQVGQVAAEIRSLKKPEPYKGKGIKYADEQIRRKAGKAGK
ncbi:MAG: 50S ribosomal protein L6 [Candidatus Nomurabacteria bacterium]|jgi:large subunit ribosomal protein L6|nr:50S ribosomal protein L6 [Candidatus Nomurabacteria bacterium]